MNDADDEVAEATTEVVIAEARLAEAERKEREAVERLEAAKASAVEDGPST